MKTLRVPDMHCGMCTARISKALTDKGISFKTDLENRTVQVDDDQVAAVIKTLGDIGYSAQE